MVSGQPPSVSTGIPLADSGGAHREELRDSSPAGNPVVHPVAYALRDRPGGLRPLRYGAGLPRERQRAQRAQALSPRSPHRGRADRDRRPPGRGRLDRRGGGHRLHAVRAEPPRRAVRGDRLQGGLRRRRVLRRRRLLPPERRAHHELPLAPRQHHELRPDPRLHRSLPRPDDRLPLPHQSRRREGGLLQLRRSLPRHLLGRRLGGRHLHRRGRLVRRDAHSVLLDPLPGSGVDDLGLQRLPLHPQPGAAHGLVQLGPRPERIHEPERDGHRHRGDRGAAAARDHAVRRGQHDRPGRRERQRLATRTGTTPATSAPTSSTASRPT